MNPDFESYKNYRLFEANKRFVASMNTLYATFNANLRAINASRVRNKQPLVNNLVAQYNQSVAALRSAFLAEINRIKSMALPVTSPVASSGTKKALLIGVNYLGTPYQLSGCIDDTTRMKDTLTELGFTSFSLLTDNTDTKPTKGAILQSLTTMLSTAVAGDVLVFYFSGHGSCTFDYTGDETDGKDEMIISSDLQGVLDDELKRILVSNMKEGVTLFGLFDSCHSGTMFDLKYNYLDSTNYDKYTENDRVAECPGNVLMISGCMDAQTSEEALVNGKVEGAVSWAFLEALKQKGVPVSMSWRNLLQKMRDLLKASEFTQIPQMSTDSFSNIDTPIFL